jgi:hypothetical protein
MTKRFAVYRVAGGELSGGAREMEEGEALSECYSHEPDNKSVRARVKKWMGEARCGQHYTPTHKLLVLCTTERAASYGNDFSPEDQVDAEEMIAAVIHDFQDDMIGQQEDTCKDQTLTVEDCGDLGRLILLLVLQKFRPDLIAVEPANSDETE